MDCCDYDNKLYFIGKGNRQIWIYDIMLNFCEKIGDIPIKDCGFDCQIINHRTILIFVNSDILIFDIYNKNWKKSNVKLRGKSHFQKIFVGKEEIHVFQMGDFRKIHIFIL